MGLLSRDDTMCPVMFQENRVEDTWVFDDSISKSLSIKHTAFQVQ